PSSVASSCRGDHRHLHSFPTRRSSDLGIARQSARRRPDRAGERTGAGGERVILRVSHATLLRWYGAASVVARSALLYARLRNRLEGAWWGRTLTTSSCWC